MQMANKFLPALTLAAFFLLTLPCRSHGTASSHMKHPLKSGPELRTVFFKPSLPAEGQSLSESTTQPAMAAADAKRDAQLILATHSNARFRTVGHTDDRECLPADCLSLGLRRAKALQATLEGYGVSAARFAPPASSGSSKPIADNNRSDERGFNRRATVEVVVEQD